MWVCVCVWIWLSTKVSFVFVFVSLCPCLSVSLSLSVSASLSLSVSASLSLSVSKYQQVNNWIRKERKECSFLLFFFFAFILFRAFARYIGIFLFNAIRTPPLLLFSSLDFLSLVSLSLSLSSHLNMVTYRLRDLGNSILLLLSSQITDHRSQITDHRS